MLTQDAPTFANWDQDETAVADRYGEQDPATVAARAHGRRGLLRGRVRAGARRGVGAHRHPLERLEVHRAHARAVRAARPGAPPLGRRGPPPVTPELLYLLLGASLLLAAVLPQLLHRWALSAPIVLVATGMLVGLLPPLADVRARPRRGPARGRARHRDHRARRAHGRRPRARPPAAVARPGVVAGVVAGLAPARHRDAADDRRRWPCSRGVRSGSPLPAAAAPRRRPGARPTPCSPPTSRSRGRRSRATRRRSTRTTRCVSPSRARPGSTTAWPSPSSTPRSSSRRLGPVSEWGLRLGRLGARRQGGRRGARRCRRRVGHGEAGVPRPRPLAAAGRGGRATARAGRAARSPTAPAEVVGGYGFLAVFACALTVRSVERDHDYHRHMHDVVHRLETLLTLVVLLGLGFALTNGLLAHLDWRGVVVGLALVLVIRPVAGYLAFLGHRTQVGASGLDPMRAPRRRLLRGPRGRVDLLRRLRGRGGVLPRGAVAVVDRRLHHRALGAGPRHPRDAGDAARLDRVRDASGATNTGAAAKRGRAPRTLSGMPSASTLLAFAAASVVIIAIPGPSVLFTIGRALSAGSAGGPAHRRRQRPRHPHPDLRARRRARPAHRGERHGLHGAQGRRRGLPRLARRPGDPQPSRARRGVRGRGAGGDAEPPRGPGRLRRGGHQPQDHRVLRGPAAAVRRADDRGAAPAGGPRRRVRGAGRASWTAPSPWPRAGPATGSRRRRGEWRGSAARVG